MIFLQQTLSLDKLKSDSYYTTQHIAVPARSVERKREKIIFSRVYFAKVYFSKMNFRNEPDYPHLISFVSFLAHRAVFILNIKMVR